MAIQVSGTEVISNARALNNIASVDATTAASMTAAGVGVGSWAKISETTWASVVGVDGSSSPNVTVSSHTLAKEYKAITWYAEAATITKSPFFGGAWGVAISAKTTNALTKSTCPFWLEAWSSSSGGSATASGLKGSASFGGLSWYNGVNSAVEGGNTAYNSSWTFTGTISSGLIQSGLQYGFPASTPLLSGTTYYYAPIAYNGINGGLSSYASATGVKIQLWGLS